MLPVFHNYWQIGYGWHLLFKCLQKELEVQSHIGRVPLVQRGKQAQKAVNIQPRGKDGYQETGKVMAQRRARSRVCTLYGKITEATGGCPQLVLLQALWLQQGKQQAVMQQQSRHRPAQERRSLYYRECSSSVLTVM